MGLCRCERISGACFLWWGCVVENEKSLFTVPTFLVAAKIFLGLGTDFLGTDFLAPFGSGQKQNLRHNPDLSVHVHTTHLSKFSARTCTSTWSLFCPLPRYQNSQTQEHFPPPEKAAEAVQTKDLFIHTDSISEVCDELARPINNVPKSGFRGRRSLSRTTSCCCPRAGSLAVLGEDGSGIVEAHRGRTARVERSIILERGEQKMSNPGFLSGPCVAVQEGVTAWVDDPSSSF